VITANDLIADVTSIARSSRKADLRVVGLVSDVYCATAFRSLASMGGIKPTARKSALVALKLSATL
jgi:hypothetical protein